jgi:hypothetical protein
VNANYYLSFIPVLCLIASVRPGIAANCGDDPLPEIGVVMQFDEHYSPISFGEMKREIESIMRPCTLRFEWRVLDQNTPQESFENLVITHFRGSCSGAGITGTDHRVNTLGMTHISDSEILPFSDIDCNKIRGFVAPEVKKRSPSLSDLLLGRALGRVLAHEMYHMFTRTPRHSSHGVAKRALTPSDLVSDNLQLDLSETSQIRECLHARKASPAGGLRLAQRPVPEQQSAHVQEAPKGN